jgi:AcrR family transcriptional regulator
VAATNRISIEEIRQTELIDAALRTISRLGFDRTTVRDIARAAGASPGSVSYYFQSKEELLRAAVADSDARFRTRLRAALAETEGSADKLKRMAGYCFPDHPEEGPDWNVFIDFWQQASRRDDFRSIFEAANNDWLGMLIEVMEAGIRSGELAIRGDVRDEAMAFAALIDGLALHTRVTEHVNGAVARRLLEQCVDQYRSRTVRSKRQRR